MFQETNVRALYTSLDRLKLQFSSSHVKFDVLTKTYLLGNIPRAAKPNFLPIFGPSTPEYGSFKLHDMESGIPFWQRSSSVCEVRFLNSWVILPNLLGT